MLSSSGAASPQDAPQAQHVAKNEKQVYYSLKDKSYNPKQKVHLVLALPGGSGEAADFLPWLGRIRNSLGKDYVMAALSAPQWTEKQAASHVWVTKHARSRYPEAKFSSEEFMLAVHQQLIKKEHLMLASVTLLGWSSSGPAVYAAAIAKKSPFDGALVVCSVFKPDQYQLKHAKGQRFYLLQGQEDKVTPLRFAEKAQEMLKKKGAKVHLEIHEGGHGFGMQDPLGRLKAGFQWLIEA